MKNYILGIETSCDDTSIAILNNGNVIDCITISSKNKLSNFGGIIPEIASREHVTNILKVFKKLIIKNNIKFNEINLIAYTSEPGIQVSLHIGKIFALTLAWYLNIEVIKVNHIYAHIFSPFINKKNIDFPFLSLIISGGTTTLYKVDSIYKIEIINSTSDDALGEAYDKIGRYLGLPYPGGPSIDKIFDIKKVKYKFQIPKSNNNFSFSGIKSKVQKIINNDLENIDVVELASSFQFWAISTLIDKIEFYSNEFQINYVCIGGGVSSNYFFRKKILNSNLNYFFPIKEFSCDNGAMIAFLAFLYKKL